MGVFPVSALFVRESIRRFLALCALVVLTSCAQFREIERGKITTPSITITANDGSFTLRSGEDFEIPFYGEEHIIAPSNLTVEDFSWYEKRGAKRVRVSVGSRQLHGVLYFSRVPPGAPSSMYRMLELIVPESYVDAASNGRASVVYDVWDTGLFATGSLYKCLVSSWGSWILWMSDYEL